MSEATTAVPVADTLAAVRAPVIELPTRPLSTAVSLGESEVFLNRNETQVGTVTLTPPPASVKEKLTHDLVVDVNTQVEGRTVGGLSFLLARANVTPPRLTPGPIKIVSQKIGENVPQPTPTLPKVFELAAPLAPEAARQSVVQYLATRKVPIVQDNSANGLISSSAIPLTHDALIQAVTPGARSLIQDDVTGKYFLSVHITPGTPPSGAVQPTSSHVQVSVRILQNAGDLDSPLGGRLVPSNGSIEQSFLSEFTTRLNAQ